MMSMVNMLLPEWVDVVVVVAGDSIESPNTHTVSRIIFVLNERSSLMKNGYLWVLTMSTGDRKKHIKNFDVSDGK